MFDPTRDYEVYSRDIPICDFHEYREEFVTRPPYQRKSVWSRKKQQALLDSLLRRYYVPRIVLREVRKSDDETVLEVIDGQQRIDTVQRFVGGELKLPKSLRDLDAGLPGKSFPELPADLRRFVDREVKYQADVIKQIDDPLDPSHQEISTEIFWRLQQGESLNTMEVAHARLSSRVRNFVVKYADDQRFDFETYHPVDENPDKLRFFRLLNRSNSRMQHLALMARFVMLERENGPCEIKDTALMELIDATQADDGIGDDSFENEPEAKAVLSTLRQFTEILADDPMVITGGKVKELRIEYFIISAYILLRHLRRWYVFKEDEQAAFRTFLFEFHERWRKRKESDSDILIFSDNRQQSGPEIALRDRILRQLFFEFLAGRGQELIAKDTKRAFSESERIQIYREADGLCEACLAESLPEDEAVVPWSEFEADHVLPHAKGGQTVIENAQLLCRAHNRRKGARV